MDKTTKKQSGLISRWLSQHFRKSKKQTGQLQPGEFTDELVEPEDARQWASSDSLRSLLKTAIANAEQIAASIKMRAQKEAEAEATRIIAQAQLEVKEIKGRAEIDAQKRAEEIISAANNKAEITEAETKHKALQFLIGVGEEVEKEIIQDYRRAYSRLSSSLRDLMNEGQDIEAELKNKVDKLWKSKSLELKEHEARLLSTSEAGVSVTIETPAPVETESVPDMATIEKSEEPARAEKEAITETEEPALLEKETIVEEVEEPAQLEKEAIAEKAEEPALLEKETIVEEVEEPAQLEKEAITEETEEPARAEKEAITETEEPAQLEKEAIAEKAEEPALLEKEAIAEKAEEPALLEKETIVEEVEEPAQAEKETATERDEEPALLKLDSQGIYNGEVELLIAPMVELRLVSRLYNYLQTVPELKILYTRGSWDQGTTITVVPDKPMPLIDVISKTPGIEVTAESLEKGSQPVEKSSLLIRSEKRGAKRIKLMLKES